MPLTHVCIWDEKTGYRHITVEEACQIFPYGVPAESGKLVCELCGQYVGLTKPGSYARHFRHTSADQKKICEDRAQIYDRIKNGYDAHPMPIKIELHPIGYHLKLGFFPIPSSDTNRPLFHKAKILCDDGRQFEYSYERFTISRVTYLSVGSHPSENYQLVFENPIQQLHRYWPSSVPGIDPGGVFFDVLTGKMLHNGGKAYPDREYYLLQKKKLRSVPNGITYEPIAETRLNFYTSWYLYKIHIHEFSPFVARFFLERSIFLSEAPIDFHPIWPIYVGNPYFLYHNGANIYFHMLGGESELHIYPSNTRTEQERLESGSLYKIQIASNEQLLSFGQSGTAGFSYAEKTDLSFNANLPEVQIKDINGDIISENCLEKLPKGRQIFISAPFDGKVEILKNGNIQGIHPISESRTTTVDRLSKGTEIRIFQGCDLVRDIQFSLSRREGNLSDHDQQFVYKLEQCRGEIVPVSHSLGAIVSLLGDYPLTKKWVYAAIRKGKIYSTAQKLLVNEVQRRTGKYDT